jgi:hypothetical protein
MFYGICWYFSTCRQIFLWKQRYYFQRGSAPLHEEASTARSTAAARIAREISENPLAESGRELGVMPCLSWGR